MAPPSRASQGAVTRYTGGYAAGVTGSTIHNFRSYLVLDLVAADGGCARRGARRRWVFGRLGCTLVHDHIGSQSNFLLAIRFPDGPRHDLGWYELLYPVVVLVPAVVVLGRRPRPAGTSVAVLALLYVPFRFFADFLRQTDLPSADARYLGLTVGQYGCVILALVGVAVAIRIRRQAARAS
jgi:phosphatidylglycerol:prolipoprotein diacylglycerol transferase